MTLEELGWNPLFAEEFAACRKKGWKPARLIRDNKITYGALFGGGDELEVHRPGALLGHVLVQGRAMLGHPVHEPRFEIGAHRVSVVGEDGAQVRRPAIASGPHPS